MKVLNALLFRQTYNLHNFYLQFAWLLFTKYIELLCQSENITFRPKTFSDYDSLFTPGSNWKEATMKPPDLSYGECQISRKFVWRHAGDVYPIPVTLLSKCLFSFNFSDHAMRLNLRSANFAFMAKMISIRRIIILPANQYPCCFEGWRKTWFGWEYPDTDR